MQVRCLPLFSGFTREDTLTQAFANIVATQSITQSKKSFQQKQSKMPPTHHQAPQTGQRRRPPPAQPSSKVRQNSHLDLLSFGMSSANIQTGAGVDLETITSSP
jgi:hypothetical protein